MFDLVGVASAKRWTAALLILCAAAASAASARAEDALRIGGTGMALANMRAIAEAFQAAVPGAQVEIEPTLGSSGGIRAVLAGAIDIALSARPLTEAEREQGAVATAYARTPFVLVTAAAGQAWPVSTADLAAIYRGDRNEWPDGTPIRVVLRPEEDSTTAELRRLSPAMGDALEAIGHQPGLPIAVTDQEAMEMAERLPGSLTPMSLMAVLAEGRSLIALPLDGVAPSADSLADGSYPHAMTVMVVTGADPGPAVQRFIGFLGSAPSQAILRRQGALPLLGGGEDH